MVLRGSYGRTGIPARRLSATRQWLLRRIPTAFPRLLPPGQSPALRRRKRIHVSLCGQIIAQRLPICKKREFIRCLQILLDILERYLYNDCIRYLINFRRCKYEHMPVRRTAPVRAGAAVMGHIFTVLSRNGLDGALCACELCAQPSGGVQTQRVSFLGEEMAIPSAAPLSGELGVFVSDTRHEFFSIEQQGG